MRTKMISSLTGTQQKLITIFPRLIQSKQNIPNSFSSTSCLYSNRQISLDPIQINIYDIIKKKTEQCLSLCTTSCGAEQL